MTTPCEHVYCSWLESRHEHVFTSGQRNNAVGITPVEEADVWLRYSWVVASAFKAS